MQMKQTNALVARARPIGRLINQSMAAAALMCLTLILGACASESPGERVERVGGVTAAQIINDPNAYVGRTVTVSGDVEEIHGPHAFNIDSGASAGELLVVGREPFPQVPDGGSRAYVVNDTATVTGVVRLLVTAEVERELGWDLTPELEAEFNARPVLVAQQVAFLPGANLNTAAGNAANMNTANSDQTLTDFNAIITAPDKQSLIGRRVQLDGVRVQGVVSDRGFWLGEADKRMFARLDRRLNQGSAEWDVVIRDGQTRTLWGEIRALPSMEEIREWKLINASDSGALQDRGVYIHVERLKETLRPVSR